jgi:hypothetical protein
LAEPWTVTFWLSDAVALNQGLGESTAEERLGLFGALVLWVNPVAPVLQGRDGTVLRWDVSLLLSMAWLGLAASFSGV